MIRAGVATVDITPPAGLPLSGFAARTLPATGAHDPLTVRALAINDTAMVVADVIGLHGAMSARIRRRCTLPDTNVIISALHNHGGPVSMAGRLTIETDEAYLQRLEDACVEAIDQAVAAQRPAMLSVGLGSDPDIARNRRHPDGPVDRALPLLRVRGENGDMIALMTGYACHPVVLGADNRLWTADYPHFVRRALETAYPGATALFVTGCVGDANTGHSAHASISLATNPDRSFAAAERIGAAIAKAALEAPEQALGGDVTALEAQIVLPFERRETETPAELATRWRTERASAEPAQAALLEAWTHWAETIALVPADALSGRVSLLDWGGLPVIGLPGEIFAATALSLRAACGERPAFIAGFAEDNPGYIPPREEFSSGGYEVDEAHRYYGQPASFAPGCAEALAGAAVELLKKSRPGRD
ncbi:neutral/alkaline non-lysosomal ceramidase N-terminal domain-containing protein [Nitratireductor aquimarinus]|uniref:neutral/alkaline non-lysosomal ceramidase N-terminal domain-containing protein n=1 Tax=Nitratireductor TaxID=245876 RepID=UPI001A8CFA83|nr:MULTISPECIES: neutral/alkaline non-lysosomal ceramidase N-terminal domain-containing protein [Nitratireductor]MBN8243674.1 neutral/alkaline non-lysosomal ceramidase N-terminal domain-containing protein [Nitratireductor aquimarinus]MBY6132391.1 neutral/alkaline non-lysosomal ceramidase N-terminal domain-containing protein [Nitratireductor aquimarinus]MCA1303113.1 neutral/alkaline non-lysosomal ceramidase N-terminal domain-containing protein [Nitratireductor aquimarinus]MCV0378897.1 neutral/al